MMLKTVAKIMLPLLVLALGVGGAILLIKNRPKPAKQQRPDQAYLVEIIEVERKTHRVDVRAQGVVEASRRITLQAEVSGKLVHVSEELVPGGLFSRGDLIARVDTTDYRIALKERQSGLTEAEARLQQERGQQLIAERELELFTTSMSGEREESAGGELKDASLALRGPQLTIAQVGVEAAEARLDLARAELARASIKAPFNAIVLSEDAEIGQLVSSQSVLATLAGTDAFWIRASVPMEQLKRIVIPGFNAAREEPGSRVSVKLDLGRGDARANHVGQVVRVLGELDQVGRMAQILIEVEDPLSLKAAPEGEAKRAPLLLGSYVEVRFDGASESELVEVPRRSIHDGDTVWVYGQEGQLEVRRVEINATFEQSVLVSSGLSQGERLIVSDIGTPIEGMRLRLAEEAPQQSGRSAEPEAERGER